MVSSFMLPRVHMSNWVYPSNKNTLVQVKTRILFLFIFSISNTILCNELPEFQNNILLSLKTINEEINSLSNIINKGELHSINSKTVSKSPKNNLNKNQVLDLIQDLDYISGLIDKYKGNEVVKPLDMRKDVLNQLDDQLINQHTDLNNYYINYFVDESFFSKNMKEPGRHGAMANNDGIWVCNDGTGYYHAYEMYSYWAPLGKVEGIRSPLNDHKIVSSELCGDARNIYVNEWNNYVNTTNRKDKLKKDVIDFQEYKIAPIINKYYLNKLNILIVSLVDMRNKKKEQEYQFVSLVKKIENSGVSIPIDKRLDYKFIYKAVESFGVQLGEMYGSFLKMKKKRNYTEAAYHIFSLVAMDKKMTHKNGHQDAIQYRKKYSKKIHDDFHNNRNYIKQGDFENFSEKPLSKFDFIVLVGLTDLKLLPNYNPSNNDKYELPDLHSSFADLNKIISNNNLTILNDDDFDRLTKIDSYKIENTYLKQLGKNKLKYSNIDELGFNGLFLGKFIVLEKQLTKEIIVKEFGFGFEESWGIKKYSLRSTTMGRFDGITKLNIRIKK